LQDRIRKLIEDLGSDDFQTREAATAALTEIGEPAVDALTEAAKSADPEVSNRAKRILGTE
jgi:HEAT repeat protein